MRINSAPFGWVNCFLGDVIVRVVGGGTPSRGILAYWIGNISWASVKDFTDDTKYIQNTEEHISSSGLANSAANLIEAGIPVICTRMAVGRAAISAKSIAINQDLKALYPNNNIDSKYLLILLKFLRPQFESLSIGSTVKGINIDQLLTISVSLPPLYEQQRITEILDTVDEAIARTSSLIIKLKQTKAGLLQDLLTRGLDEDGKLRDPQAHPEQFKDSPLGRIPKDWEAKPLAAIANLQVGFAFKSEWFQEHNGVKLLRGENVGYGSPDWSETRTLPWNMYPNYREYELVTGDIIIGMDRTFTKSGVKISVLKPSDVPALLVQRVGRFLPIECDQQFLKTLLSSQQYHNILLAQQKGMDIPHLSKSEILDPLVTVPAIEEQSRIAAIIDTHDTRIRAEEAYLNKLKLQKQGLMQDLLTGKVRVSTIK
jgi:type I restriction enzyme S subunit